jgi:hypothetical protein
MADLLHTFGPSNVATLLTTTIENRRGEIKDAIFNDLVTIKYLKDKNKVTVQGGAGIVMPLMYAKNGTAQFYNGYDTLNVTPQEGFTATQFKWKEAAVSISLSNREENIQNTGKQEVFSIVKAKMDQAEMSLKDVLNTAIFAAAPGANDLGSLVTTIDATSTIGDINSTTSSWWQSLVTTSGSFAAQGRSDMLTTWNTLITRGGGVKPTDLILTTPTVHGYYEGSLIPQQRYESAEQGNASFKSLMFKTAPVVFDTACTSGAMYFLNSDALELIVHSNQDFKLTEWVKPSNQTARTAQMVVALELTTNNRRRLGKMLSITA